MKKVFQIVVAAVFIVLIMWSVYWTLNFEGIIDAGLADLWDWSKVNFQ